jgi:ribosomal protein RSM22 (predicted rRNA methylase)
MLSLPENLESAIREILKTVPPSKWVREAQALSRRYRGRRERLATPLAKGGEQAIAYLAQIFPATYAQLFGAMAATRAQAQDWTPTSLLDIGSGPGTALWAAVEHWPSLMAINVWDREPAFIALGQQLAQASDHPGLRSAEWQKVDLRRPLPHSNRSYDLIIIGHVLNELGGEHQTQVVDWAWEHGAGVLLIVEPGTSAAFPAVKRARDRLLAMGARTLAPCPHDHPCPLVDDWCHFPQRLRRPQFQRRAKAALSPWEDCKFAFAAMARFAPERLPWARIIREPQVTKAYAEVKLCTAEGITRRRDFKTERDAFQRAKKLQWGEVLGSDFLKIS